MAKITMDMVIGAFIQTRTDIAELESRISEHKQLQSRREEYMMGLLTEAGVTSMASKHGTVYTTTAESVTVADAETFFDWVKETGNFDCLEKRAAKTAVLEIMGDKEDSGRPNPPPPGLNYVSIRKIGVRKPS